MQSLNKPRNIFSGVAEGVYIACAHWFAPGGIKAPPADDVLVTETHQFPTGSDGFLFMQLAPQKNSITGRSIGELGTTNKQIELKVFVPGSYVEVHRTLLRFKGKPLVALIKDSNCPANFFYMLGNACVGAWLSDDFTTGTTVDGVKGYEVTITTWSKSITLYQGGVQVMEDFPENGTPLFSSTSVRNDSLSAIRAAYLTSQSRNSTTIYNLCRAAQQAGLQTTAAFRDTAGASGSTQLANTDMATYAKFLAWLRSVVPTGTTLQPYSTGLLVVSASIEHYLGIEIRTPGGYLINFDGGYLLNADGSRLMV